MPQRRGVIVNAEMHAPAAAFRRLDERAERDLAALVDDRLRRFDHRFDPERAGRQAVLFSSSAKRRDGGGHLRGQSAPSGR